MKWNALSHFRDRMDDQATKHNNLFITPPLSIEITTLTAYEFYFPDYSDQDTLF